MTLELHAMRRRFGLTQIQLAEIMGLTQSTISRWERGIEPIRHCQRLELLDLFSNRNGILDPLVKRLISNASNLTAFDFDLKCHAAADFLMKSAKMEKSDVMGKDYSQICESEWFTEVYADVPVEERVYFEYEHLLRLHGPEEVDVPIRTKQYFVQFDDSPGLMLSLISHAAPLTTPRVIKRMGSDAFDSN